MTPRDLLIHWRKAAGLSQPEAAAVFGYRTFQTISEKERGNRGVSELDLKIIRQHALANGIDLPKTTKETEPTE